MSQAVKQCVAQGCAGTEFVLDEHTSEFVCTLCGTVCDDQRIVSEVTFGENAAGGAVVHGSFVGADQARPRSGPGGVRGHDQGESRMQTLHKTLQRIQKVAYKLDIQEHIQSRALNYFKHALNSNFVKGRRSQYVVCACLYLACRQNGTRHMLMDFAEATYVNVFAIGATYLQLVQALRVTKVPPVDPSVYLQKFVSQLDYDDKAGQRVMADAKRVIERMKKDWLLFGRRPAGVAAAALVIASNMNNFRRSRAQIVQIAKIAEETVQRRLNEFRQTSTATLTVQDFRHTNIESEADPPSFTRHREREKLLIETRRQYEEDLQNGIAPVEDEDRDLEDMAKSIEDNVNALIAKMEAETSSAASTSASQEPSEPEADEDEKLQEEKLQEEKRQEERRQLERSRELPRMLIEKYREANLQRRLQYEEKQRQREAAQDADNEPDNLSDVDDDEISSSVLSEEEVRIKSQLWMSLNRDYLVEQENKRLKIEADKRAGIYKAPKKRRKRGADAVKVADEDDRPVTAAESAIKMTQTRKISKKINYDAIQSLFREPETN